MSMVSRNGGAGGGAYYSPAAHQASQAAPNVYSEYYSSQMLTGRLPNESMVPQNVSIPPKSPTSASQMPWHTACNTRDYSV